MAAPGLAIVMNGVVQEPLPARAGSNPNVAAPLRLDAFGDLLVSNVFNGWQQAAQEGSFYVAQTATPGTGITLTSATGTTFSDTNSILGINNIAQGNSLGGSKPAVIPAYVKLLITAAGTAATSSHVAGRLDTAARYSGGSELTGFNVHGEALVVRDPVARIFAGAITTAGASNLVRNVGRGVLRSAAAPAFVVNDVILIVFGQVENPAVFPNNTGASVIVVPMPQVVIPPGWSYGLAEWAPARTAAQSAEVEVGYIVR